MTLFRTKTHLFLVRFPGLTVAHFFLCAFLLWPLSLKANSDTIGDRLLVAINNYSFSQRHLESYLAIKESFRRVDNTSARVILPGPENWADALNVFEEDMLIYLETSRLGSFSPTDEAMEKGVAIVNKRMADSVELANWGSRLGWDSRTIRTMVDHVLRIAAYRRSKDRQTVQPNSGRGPVRFTQPTWLADLKERALIRRYQGAGDHIKIQPTLGEATDAL